MSQQSFRDESNRKHEPHAKHYVDDKFGKGTQTRNWNQDIDEGVEASSQDVERDQDQDSQIPPGSPERTPVDEPDEAQKAPMGDKKKPSQKKPRL